MNKISYKKPGCHNISCITLTILAQATRGISAKNATCSQHILYMPKRTGIVQCTYYVPNHTVTTDIYALRSYTCASKLTTGKFKQC